MSERGFIEELCIALTHRWEPERGFMILTAYFDESGTHAGSDVAVMAGFLGDARQWRKFEKRASKLFARFKVNIFHSIDVRRTDKDFVGWPVDRKIEFIDEFYHIVNDTLEFGVAAVIKFSDYKYYESKAWPRTARRDTLYAILFRTCLSAVTQAVISGRHLRDGVEPRLNVVLESGARNADDAVRLYQSVIAHFGNHRALSGLTFQDKARCLPLAAADLLAYTVYGDETGRKPMGTAKRRSKSVASYRGNFYRIAIDRESLDALYEQAVANARLRLVSSSE